jgi:hypothetical protein
MKKIATLLLLVSLNYGCISIDTNQAENPITISNSYTIVDTGVVNFYNNTATISSPLQGSAFYGQDASYNKINLRIQTIMMGRLQIT